MTSIPSLVDSIYYDGNTIPTIQPMSPEPEPIITLQEKTIPITENGETQVTPDEGYDGLSLVKINTLVPSQQTGTYGELSTQSYDPYYGSLSLTNFTYAPAEHPTFTSKLVYYFYQATENDIELAQYNNATFNWGGDDMIAYYESPNTNTSTAWYLGQTLYNSNKNLKPLVLTTTPTNNIALQLHNTSFDYKSTVKEWHMYMSPTTLSNLSISNYFNIPTTLSTKLNYLQVGTYYSNSWHYITTNLTTLTVKSETDRLDSYSLCIGYIPYVDQWFFFLSFESNSRYADNNDFIVVYKIDISSLANSNRQRFIINLLDNDSTPTTTKRLWYFNLNTTGFNWCMALGIPDEWKNIINADFTLPN